MKREGTKFVCEIPKGYEGCVLKPFGDTILLAHPEHPPLILKDGVLKPLEAA